MIDLRLGDCLEIMPMLPANSVDTIVTDPPYGLAFMGKNWDHGVPGVHFWQEALRVAKPGAHLLAFGGTRTSHRLACAIEDAGWEIRDTIMWVYAQGFPKSHNLRDEWAGWGTALKPSWEPVIVARKPLQGTVAANVLTWGTGAINVDGCRVEGVPPSVPMPQGGNGEIYGFKNGTGRNGKMSTPSPAGRWPANLVHDGSDEVLALFPVTTSGKPNGSTRHVAGYATAHEHGTELTGFGDTGSAARFFYCAKASKSDRESGLDSIEIVMLQYVVWENEVQQVKLRVDTEQSPPRVIVASGTMGGIEWNTLLSGKPITALFQTVTKSITATGTSSITASPTLSWLTRWLTNEYMAGVSIETGNGTNHAANADKSTPLLTITNGGMEFRLGADNAPLTTQWRIKGNAGSPADHPTVKPTSLMRWLVRLVTPPGGVVLDPFMGSGSTGKAAIIEGFAFVGIEQDAEYLEIASRRIEAAQLPLLVQADDA